MDKKPRLGSDPLEWLTQLIRSLIHNIGGEDRRLSRDELTEIEKMENPNKIKWEQELLVGVPILAGIILSIYIGDTFWRAVVLIFTVIYSVIYFYLLAQKIIKR